MGPTTSVDPLRWWESVSSPGGKNDKEGHDKEGQVKYSKGDFFSKEGPIRRLSVLTWLSTGRGKEGPGGRGKEGQVR